MKNPNPVNLQTSAEIRTAGWQAECRDADGHLCRTHVPFETDEEIVWLVREALEHGETVTIWPNSKIATTPPPSSRGMGVKGSLPAQSCERSRTKPHPYRAHQEGTDRWKSLGAHAPRDAQHERHPPRSGGPILLKSMVQANEVCRASCTPPSTVSGCALMHSAISANGSDLPMIHLVYPIGRPYATIERTQHTATLLCRAMVCWPPIICVVIGAFLRAPALFPQLAPVDRSDHYRVGLGLPSKWFATRADPKPDPFSKPPAEFLLGHIHSLSQGQISSTETHRDHPPPPSQEEVTPVDLTSRSQNVQVAPQRPNLDQPEGEQTKAAALAEHVLAAPMWPRSKTCREEPPKQQEPESGSLSGSMRRNWVQLAADIGRPRNSLTIPIRRYPFGEARRVAPVIFMDHSSSPPTMTVVPATVLATFPAAMQARTVISTNDDAVRIGSGRDGNDGRKSQSYSNDDFFHGALPEVIGPRINDCPVFAFHQKTHFGLQSEETSDHWRTCGKPLWKPGRQ